MSSAAATTCASLDQLGSLTNSHSAPVANGAELSLAALQK